MVDQSGTAPESCMLILRLSTTLAISIYNCLSPLRLVEYYQLHGFEVLSRIAHSAYFAD